MLEVFPIYSYASFFFFFKIKGLYLTMNTTQRSNVEVAKTDAYQLMNRDFDVNMIN